jgi:hypothetical protein
MEQVFSQFDESLAAGHLNENVVAHEFEYQGIPVKRTEGKNDFDFFLPSGHACEVKLDIRSQATNSGCIEFPTLARHADFYLHTFTYCKVFTWEEYNRLYMTGKVINGGAGQYNYDAHYIRQRGQQGTPLYQFINQLKQTT